MMAKHAKRIIRLVRFVYQFIERLGDNFYFLFRYASLPILRSRMKVMLACYFDCRRPIFFSVTSPKAFFYCTHISGTGGDNRHMNKIM